MLDLVLGVTQWKQLHFVRIFGESKKWMND